MAGLLDKYLDLNVAYRGSLLPFARMRDGSVSLAWPSALTEFGNALAYTGDVTTGRKPLTQRGATDTMMGLAGGAFGSGLLSGDDAISDAAQKSGIDEQAFANLVAGGHMAPQVAPIGKFGREYLHKLPADELGEKFGREYLHKVAQHFDPARSKSRDILTANPSTASILGLLKQIEQEEAMGKWVR